MHGIGAHSAVAIKRQRRRREQAAKRRPRKTRAAIQQQQMSNKVMGTITMQHVGVVFLMVGLFLVLAAVITNETKQSEIAELIGTGITCLVIGLFLVILNRFYGQKEEEELQNYVEQRLGRSRSGQRLYHEQDSYPEHLDEEAMSKTPSMDSGLSNDLPKGKKDKKDKKKKGISGPSSGGHGSSDNQNSAPIASVSIINEHQNHHQSYKNPPAHSRGGQAQQQDEISSGGVVLDEHGRSGNLYRVYNSTTA